MKKVRKKWKNWGKLPRPEIFARALFFRTFGKNIWCQNDAKIYFAQKSNFWSTIVAGQNSKSIFVNFLKQIVTQFSVSFLTDIWLLFLAYGHGMFQEILKVQNPDARAPFFFDFKSLRFFLKPIYTSRIRPKYVNLFFILGQGKSLLNVLPWKHKK